MCAPCCSLASFAGGVVIPQESVLTVPCDVLIPAAIGGVIDEDNARDLQCKVGIKADSAAAAIPSVAAADSVCWC